MQSMDIIELIKKPEGKTLEFKRDLSSPHGIMRTIVSFANTAGGVLLIGIEDKKNEVCGVETPLDLEEQLANLISDRLEPRIVPEIEILPWRSTYLVAVQVFPSSVKPHYIKKAGVEKGTYVRVGSTNRLAGSTLIAELKRTRLDDTFDKQPLTDLNSEAVDFRAASELFAPIRKLTTADLASLDVLTDYQQKKVPTVGGIILFGKDRHKYFPDAWIQVGRFVGINKRRILDTHEIRSYPTIAIDEVMDFVKKHALHEIKIPSSFSRSRSGPKTSSFSMSRHKEKWSIPLVAVRETIINAVLHADYAQQGAPIRLAIFDDRIEIENPGLLLAGLTIDDIKRGVSKLRNRVIGLVFHRLGLIERWGSGIKRIIDSCKDAGFDEPIFEEIGTHFRTTIFIQQKYKPNLDRIDETIISILKQSNGLTTKEIATFIKRSDRATRTRLITLIEKNLVVEIGTSPQDPKRKYFLAD